MDTISDGEGSACISAVVCHSVKRVIQCYTLHNSKNSGVPGKKITRASVMHILKNAQTVGIVLIKIFPFLESQEKANKSHGDSSLPVSV